MRPIKSIVAVSILAAALINTAPTASYASDGTGSTTTASSQTPDMFQDGTATDPGMAAPGGSMDAAPGSDMTAPDAATPAPDANMSPGSPVITPETQAPSTPETPAATAPGTGGGADTDMEQDTTQKRRLRNYAVIKGGLYTPSRTFDLNTLDPQISNGRAHFQSEVGFAGELAFGRYLLPVLAMELGAGYFQSSGVATTTGNTMVRVIPVTLSAKVCLPLGPFEPYGLAGIGAYITDLDTKGNVGAFRGTTDVTYGMSLGVGFDINVARSTFIGLEGKYLWSEPSFGGQHIRIDGFITTVNVGFRF